MAQFKDENFICAKEVDRSLLRQGFTLPVKMLWEFKSWFGSLQVGESRDVTIRLNGEEFRVRLGNRNFDRSKWPDHPEMYQMRYSESGGFTKKLREIFKSTDDYVTEEIRKHGGMKRLHIALPDTMKEKLVFYRTKDPMVWDAEVLTLSEKKDAYVIQTMDERIFEDANWTDETAGIVLKPAVVKVRRLDRAIGNNLKRLYGHRCQICGEQVAENYGTRVEEVHHIDPFVTSLNNDVSNLLVLCPTHHRIIHAAHPEFVWNKLEFHYANGLHEGLRVNQHLARIGG